MAKSKRSSGIDAYLETFQTAVSPFGGLANHAVVSATVIGNVVDC